MGGMVGNSSLSNDNDKKTQSQGTKAIIVKGKIVVKWKLRLFELS